MLEICKQLFKCWNENNVSYCHWKSNEHLMEGLDGDTDLDVYVSQADKEKAEKYLVACNYKECIIQKGHRYPNVVEWIGFDESTGRLIHVHLHYQVITGTRYCKEYVFPIDNVIIDTRLRNEETGVYVTNPDLEIIILFCRIALKAKNHRDIHPDSDDLKEIKYLKDRIALKNVQSLCQNLMEDNGCFFFNLISKDLLSCDEWQTVYKIASKWLKPYRKYSRLTVFLRHKFYSLRALFIIGLRKLFDIKLVNKKTFGAQGISICFLGQDGSGKSTVTIDLCKWLNWKIEASRFYLGSGDHYNGLLKRIMSRRGESKRETTIQNNKGNNPDTSLKRKKTLKSFLCSVFVCLYSLNLSRRAYSVMKKANDYCNRGGIALFDRFPQMQFEGISDGPRIANYYKKNGLDFAINKLMAKMEYKYFYKIQQMQPSIVFKLMLSPEESIRRKPFENLENVKEKHEITKALLFPNSEVYEVDATQDYQEELIYIKKIIWKKMLSMRK